VGIVLISLACSETGWRYLASEASAIETGKFIILVNNFIIGLEVN
jgi:hypothetical protein